MHQLETNENDLKREISKIMIGRFKGKGYLSDSGEV